MADSVGGPPGPGVAAESARLPAASDPDATVGTVGTGAGTAATAGGWTAGGWTAGGGSAGGADRGTMIAAPLSESPLSESLPSVSPLSRSLVDRLPAVVSSDVVVPVEGVERVLVGSLVLGVVVVGCDVVGSDVSGGVVVEVLVDGFVEGSEGSVLWSSPSPSPSPTSPRSPWS
ncbi:hypothetical protein V1Y59_20805 [Gordonia sp. PKS22-38]|uniref:Uncharacterized protein n=1 Tax=Gordonia prachuapensis TaxID=3115651 RepID=A0ABU7MYZ8_9ACTN|nr:hypothetical protein [Gordonia sp. PKS22-38]